jgi:hypothetical protein
MSKELFIKVYFQITEAVEQLSLAEVELELLGERNLLHECRNAIQFVQYLVDISEDKLKDIAPEMFDFPWQKVE